MDRPELHERLGERRVSHSAEEEDCHHSKDPTKRLLDPAEREEFNPNRLSRFAGPAVSSPIQAVFDDARL